MAWQSWWAALITAPRVTGAMIKAGTVPVPAEPSDPLLDRAVAAIRPEAYDWLPRHEPAPTFHDDNRRRWLIAKRAVDATVADLGVSPGQISASVSLLLVQLLRETFASSVL